MFFNKQTFVIILGMKGMSDVFILYFFIYAQYNLGSCTDIKKKKVRMVKYEINGGRYKCMEEALL
jgi:hypothetical protein